MIRGDVGRHQPDRCGDDRGIVGGEADHRKHVRNCHVCGHHEISKSAPIRAALTFNGVCRSKRNNARRPDPARTAGARPDAAASSQKPRRTSDSSAGRGRVRAAKSGHVAVLEQKEMAPARRAGIGTQRKNGGQNRHCKAAKRPSRRHRSAGEPVHGLGEPDVEFREAAGIVGRKRPRQRSCRRWTTRGDGRAFPPSERSAP